MNIAYDADRDWFERTGHCGACGQPGEFCLCKSRCGCHELHPVGAGLAASAVEMFAEPGPDQDGLF